MKNILTPQNFFQRHPAEFVSATKWLLMLIILGGILLTRLESYLLFHSIVELFSIIVAFGVFIVAWNSDTYVKNSYLLVIGIGSLFIAGIDALHTLAFKGMGVFPNLDHNLATQLWLAARYLQALTFLIAPLFIRRNVKKYPTLVVFAFVTGLLLASIFAWKIFPTAYIEGSGLTLFKIVSEYVIIAILIGAIAILWKIRSEFDSAVTKWLIASIIAAIATEFMFTLYTTTTDAANLIGHIFKIIEYYLLYQALVEIGFKVPYDLITEKVKLEEEQLKELEAGVTSTFDAIAELVSIHDKDYKLVRVNKTLANFFGKKPEELIGKTCYEVFHHTDRPWPNCPHTRAMQSEQAVTEEIKDPHLGCPLMVSVSPIFDRYGDFIASVHIAKDITEQKKVEKVLEEQYSTLHSILESSSALIFSVDREYRYTSFNNAHAVVMKAIYGAEIQLGHNLLDYMTVVEDREKARQNLDRALSGEGHTQFSYSGEEKFSRRYFEVTHNPIHIEDGTVIGAAVFSQDVTDRKRAEEALQTANDYNRSLIEASLDPLVTIGPDGTITDVNHATEEATGCKRNELINTDFCDYFTDPEKARSGYQQVFREGAVRDYPLEIRHRNGHTLPVLYNATVYRDEGGNVMGVFAAARDITELKRAEEALREASLYARSLIEASLDPLATISPDGKITDVNQATEAITGTSRERLTGDDFSNYFTEPEKAREGYQKVLAEGLVRDYPLTIRHVSGKTTDVLYNATVYKNEAGETQGVFAAARDITESKRAEAEVARSLVAEKRARGIAETLREANLSLSRTLNLDDVLQNLLQYLERLVPYDSANVMLFESDFKMRIAAMRGYERWTDDDVTHGIIFDLRELPHLNEAITGRKSIFVANTYNQPGWIRYPGTEHVVNWLCIPIVAGNQVIGLYSVDKSEPGFFTEEHRGMAEALAGQAAVAIQNARLHDQIKRANAELEQRVIDRTAQLEAANKELEAFAYSVSHDLRAPLRHIDGFIELLQKNTHMMLDEKNQHYMAVISESAKKMGTLIDDLLSFSRMGRNEMVKTQINPGELIQEVIREFKPEIEERDIKWHIANIPTVTGDRAMLKVVLVNLISNALKFTSLRQQAEIEIGYMAEPKGETVIFVRDNGVGFDMNYANKLFGVFQRLHRAEDFEGTGIGLANVRRIISRHGGRTWAEGKVNNGATFYFSLPLPRTGKLS